MARKKINDGGGVKTLPAPKSTETQQVTTLLAKSAEAQPFTKSELFKEGIGQRTFPEAYVQALRFFELTNAYAGKEKINALDVGFGMNGISPYLIAYSLGKEGKQGKVTGLDKYEECVKSTKESPRLNLGQAAIDMGEYRDDAEWLAEFAKKACTQMTPGSSITPVKEVFGIDADVVQPDTKEFSGMVHLTQGDIFKYAPAEKSDFVFCIALMVHFEKDERVKIMERLVNAVRPGGYLVIDQLPEGGKIDNYLPGMFRIEHADFVSKWGLEPVFLMNKNHQVLIFQKKAEE